MRGSQVLAASCLLTPVAQSFVLPVGGRHVILPPTTATKLDAFVYGGLKAPRRRRPAATALRASAGGDVETLRRGLVNREFQQLLKEGSAAAAVGLLRNSSSLIDVDLGGGTSLIEGVSNALLTAPEPNDSDVVFAYEELRRRGVLRAFGYLGAEALPEQRRDVSPIVLESITNLPMSALTPGKDNSWLTTGIGFFLLEFIAAQLLGLNPLQTVIPATLALFVADNLLFNGATLETATRLVVPGYRSKIIKHEAGHFLLAYLLGCPVQGCVLDPWELRKFAGVGAQGGQGGTIFVDPKFTKGVQAGRLTRSSIDRFSIILMAGIAAEAVANGNAEGGGSDEYVLIATLLNVTPPFNMEQIKKQGRWAAAQAVLLITEHRAAYDALCKALEERQPLGKCILAIENALADKPLPAEERMAAVGARKDANMAGARPGMSAIDQLHLMYDQKRAAEEEGKTLADVQAERQRVHEQLADRFKALERIAVDGELNTKMAGSSGGEFGGGGVWLRDLEALKEAAQRITAEEMDRQAPAMAAQLARLGEAENAKAPATAAVGAEKREMQRLADERAKNEERIAAVEAKLRALQEREQL